MAESNLISQFKQRMSSSDPKYEVAHRPFFTINFSWETSIGPSFFENVWELNELKYVVQEVSLPALNIGGGTKEGSGATVVTFTGRGQVPNQFTVIPEDKDVRIVFLDTQYPVAEYFFLPWMEEVTKAQQDGIYPIRRAMIYVDIFDNLYQTEIPVYSYVVTGAYPKQIGLRELQYTGTGLDTPKREIIFEYNNIKIDYGSKSGSDGVIKRGRGYFWRKATVDKHTKQMSAAKEYQAPTPNLCPKTYSVGDA